MSSRSRPRPLLRRSLIAIGLALLLAVAAWLFLRYREAASMRPFSVIKSVSVRGDADAVNALGVPVAIHPLGDAKYLLADYQNVFLFDRAAGRLSLLRVDMNGIASKFVPTYFAPGGGNRVWIANYLGNNVLEAELDLASRSLKITRQVGDAGTISPEGVSVDGNFLAVANYDGGNIQVFDLSRPGAAICRLAVGNAHGIAFSGGAVYATSLLDRKLLKVDPKLCRVTASTGRMGWRPGQFLWPTGVAAAGEDIIVSDAHTGNVSVFDRERLSFKHSFGRGNGPGLDGLNMPYASVAEAGSVVIVSTFAKRIFFTDQGTLQTEVYNLASGSHWNAAAPQDAFLTGAGYKGYTSQRKVHFDGKCLRPSYAALADCERKADVKVPMYFVQAVQATEGLWVTSPQSTTALFYRSLGAPAETVSVGFDKWVIDGKLMGPGGEVPLAPPRRP